MLSSGAPSACVHARSTGRRSPQQSGKIAALRGRWVTPIRLHHSLAITGRPPWAHPRGRVHAVLRPGHRIVRRGERMEFGIFHEFPSIAGRPDAAAFDQAFELVDGAERWGLDAIWLAELHFDPARAVLSAPLC